MRCEIPLNARLCCRLFVKKHTFRTCPAGTKIRGTVSRTRPLNLYIESKSCVSTSHGHGRYDYDQVLYETTGTSRITVTYISKFTRVAVVHGMYPIYVSKVSTRIRNSIPILKKRIFEMALHIKVIGSSDYDFVSLGLSGSIDASSLSKVASR